MEWVAEHLDERPLRGDGYTVTVGWDDLKYGCNDLL
ncbi:hypothetical protein HNR61_004639 [Actinomadura namibiensis]|uniref:Uncharacterized protein n=1 Tax=Actinomadura namibiensis TaxID=182080 RepID=A0A7W3LRK5_ACTNM|nr:hypothetical protein [Actinomadura namibiensis]